MQGQNGFWDVEDRLKELSAEGDPLEKLAATVDFKISRPVLKEALGRGAGSNGRRPVSVEMQDMSASLIVGLL